MDLFIDQNLHQGRKEHLVVKAIAIFIRSETSKKSKNSTFDRRVSSKLHLLHEYEISHDTKAFLPIYVRIVEDRCWQIAHKQLISK